MTNLDKCFFCAREMKSECERFFFDPTFIKGKPFDYSTKVRSCCMGCEGKIKDFMIERETKQAVNKDGKLLFFLDDGEFWWYLGDSAEQIIEYHKKTYEGEDTIVNL
ncbi:hypothetical protein [Pelosinus baikalensis]|uniref:Uncharacterized protein n=1 Tax=Pelosinus baikalensis TaxID=2892015 RepID=A0ABS8HX99_9FIRM|nr:hypothetical protein [Pelosinus baikalensis]MCC5467650.1 hypothetical protein [Pelosinus baikalensis]